MFDRCLEKRYDQLFAVINQQLNANVSAEILNILKHNFIKMERTIEI